MLAILLVRFQKEGLETFSFNGEIDEDMLEALSKKINSQNLVISRMFKKDGMTYCVLEKNKSKDSKDYSDPGFLQVA